MKIVKFLAAVGLALSTQFASATLLRFDFTGVVTAPTPDAQIGDPIHGWLQFESDPGFSASNTVGNYFSQGIKAAGVFGELTTGGATTTFSGGNDAMQQLRIQTDGSGQQFSMYGSSTFNGQNNALTLFAATSSSNIYGDVSNAMGLDLLKKMNWFADDVLYLNYLDSDPRLLFQLETMTGTLDGEFLYCQAGNGGVCRDVPAEIPEPGSIALIAIAMGGLVIARRQRRQS